MVFVKYQKSPRLNGTTSYYNIRIPGEWESLTVTTVFPLSNRNVQKARATNSIHYFSSPGRRSPFYHFVPLLTEKHLAATHYLQKPPNSYVRSEWQFFLRSLAFKNSVQLRGPSVWILICMGVWVLLYALARIRHAWDDDNGAAPLPIVSTNNDNDNYQLQPSQSW